MQGQKKAAKAASARARAASAERRRAEELQTRRENLQVSRQRRRASAQARRFRAQAVNLAANRGAGGAIGAPGSTIPGVSGNIASQLNFNNAFINQVTGLNAQIRTAFGNVQTISGTPITAGQNLQAFGGFARAAGSGITGNAADISKFLKDL
jgi:hypothetical protein